MRVTYAAVTDGLVLWQGGGRPPLRLTGGRDLLSAYIIWASCALVLGVAGWNPRLIGGGKPLVPTLCALAIGGYAGLCVVRGAIVWPGPPILW